MSNPTFSHGPITFEISADLDKFRLVKLDDKGKLAYAGATGAVFGAITEAGRINPQDAGARNIAVHYGQSAVKLETTGNVKAGAAVFAGANGKAAATGTVAVGVAVRATEDGFTLTVLNGLPLAATA